MLRNQFFQTVRKGVVNNLRENGQKLATILNVNLLRLFFRISSSKMGGFGGLGGLGGLSERLFFPVFPKIRPALIVYSADCIFDFFLPEIRFCIAADALSNRIVHVETGIHQAAGKGCQLRVAAAARHGD